MGANAHGRSMRAPTGARAHGWSVDRSERRRVRQPTLKGASADGRSAPPCGAPTCRNECPLRLARRNASVKAPTGSARPRERPPTGGSAQVQRVSSAPRKRKASQHQTTFITERDDKLQSQVEVIVFEAKAQSLKNRPLGFWLPFKY